MSTINEIRQQISQLRRWTPKAKSVHDFYAEVSKTRSKLTEYSIANPTSMRSYDKMNNEIDKIERGYQQKIIAVLRAYNK